MERIISEITRVEASLAEQFAEFPSATVYEANGASGMLDPAIKPIYPGMRVCGSAVTVHVPGDDNLMLHKVVTVAGKGDVVVAATGAYRGCAFFGDVLAAGAQARDIAGLVIDGHVRDGAEIHELGFPVFAFGLNMRSPAKERLGTINHPIIISGTVIYPGDLVLGDDDGVVVVRRDVAAEVLQRSRERAAKEEGMLAALRQGKTTMELLGLDSKFDAE